MPQEKGSRPTVVGRLEIERDIERMRLTTRYAKRDRQSRARMSVMRSLMCVAIWTLVIGASAMIVAMQSWPTESVRFRPDASTESQWDEVIVVLAGDSERVQYASSLFGGDERRSILSTRMDVRCLQAGHPPHVCATRVRNTVDEALLMRRIVRQEQVQHLTIVTSRYHAPRATGIFRIMFAGSGIDLRVVTPPSTGPIPIRLKMQELLKFFPSIGAAVVARVSPGLYERLVQDRDN